MNPLFGILACLAVVVAGCSTDTKPIAPSSEPAAKIATDDSSTPAATPEEGSSTSVSTSAVTPDSVWASLKAQSKYTSAGSALAAFIMAAAAGDLAAVTSFVQAGVDKEGQALVTVAGIGRVRTALHAAARGGHLAVVTYLVGQGASLSSTDAVGDTPLHAAVGSGNLEIVKYLVGQGASIDAKNTAGETPLHYAAAYGHLAIVKYLDEQGADLTITSNDGSTPAQTADLSGQTAVNTYLGPKTAAEARAELTRLGIAYTAAAFVDSARTGNLAVVKLFVQAGMSVESSSLGSPVLHRAAAYGHLEVVKYLVGQGASLTAKNDSGFLVLHLAAPAGHLEVVKYLVGQGASLTAKGRNGETALHSAATVDELEVVKYLVGAGSSLTATDKWGNMALHRAAKYGQLAVVKYLVGQGASLTATGDFGLTALQWAALASYDDWEEGKEKGWVGDYLAVVKYLVGQGGLTATDSYGNTALHIAAAGLGRDLTNYTGSSSIFLETVSPFHWAVHLEVVKYLVGQGASLTATNDFGYTALHRAAAGGRLAMVKYLVGQGASLTATVVVKYFFQSSTGEVSIPIKYTARDLAAEAGHTAVVNYLDSLDDDDE